MPTDCAMVFNFTHTYMPVRTPEPSSIDTIHHSDSWGQKRQKKPQVDKEKVNLPEHIWPSSPPASLHWLFLAEMASGDIMFLFGYTLFSLAAVL